MIAFWRRRRPEIRWQLAISTRCESLGELMDMTISRVVQEALSNAVRHAEPTQISVSIGRAGDAIRVEVADDGGGIRGPNRPGYGLVGIGERVKAMGGHLTFSNRPGVGFSVVAVLPSPSPSEAASVPVQAVEP
jgi:two-component system sensor histidine kinase UhpB